MLYVYGISDCDEAPAGAVGLQGAPIRAVGQGGLNAIVSEHDSLAAAESDLWAHEAVVEAAMAGGPILPARFATTSPDEEALRGELSRRREELAAGLRRVRGAAELAVRAAHPDGGEAPSNGQTVAPDTGPGTTYMLGRLARSRRQEEIARRVHEPLARLARDSRHRLHWRNRLLLTASYLVDRGEVETFRARVEQLDDELATASISCTGPWPPYSFSSGPIPAEQ